MAASTFITRGSRNQSLMGSNEKRLDATPDGTLWLLVSEAGAGKFLFSKDGGSTWSYSSVSDLTWNHNSSQSSTYPSFYIDGEGFAHVSWVLWNRSPQLVCYARGKPRSGGGWSWTIVRWTPVGGQGVDSDLVCIRRGSGWVTHVVSGAYSKVARINVSSSGSLSMAEVNTGPPQPAGDWYNVAAVEFAHTGDGKTPQDAPHLLMVSGNQGNLDALNAWRATFASGSWTWDAPVVLDTSARISHTVLATVYDGTRLCTIYEPDINVIALRFVEWAPGSAPVRRDPPALPTTMLGRMGGVSIAHDPVTDDLYVVCHSTEGDGDVRASKFTRSTLTWSAWVEQTTDRRAHRDDSKVQLMRHAPGDAIDLVWAAHGPVGKSYPVDIYHQVVAQLVRAPEAPALGKPANGTRADLESGATFTWAYRGTGSGDAQQGWVFRRTDANGVVAYWNAGSQGWSTTEVVNPGADDRAPFPPGAWPNGQAYTWSVRTRSSSGEDGPYAADRTVVATAAPRTHVLSPSGLVFTDSTPMVEWSYASADAQRTYEVRVFTDAPDVDPEVTVPVWSSGVVTSSSGRSVRIADPLSDGGTYQVWQRSTSTTGLTSVWARSLFTLSLTPPTGPSVRARQGWSYPHEVPHAMLRLVARSNHMTEAQALGRAGWENEPNTTHSTHDANASLLLEEGLTLTAVAAGNVAVRNVLGDPPPAPVGEPQPAGPLAFPVHAGETYSAVAHVRSQDAARAARVSVRWYEDDDATAGQRRNLAAFGTMTYDHATVPGMTRGFSPYSSGTTGTVTYSRPTVEGGKRQRVEASALGGAHNDRAGVSTLITGLSEATSYVLSTEATGVVLAEGHAVILYADFADAEGNYLGTQQRAYTSPGWRPHVVLHTPAATAQMTVHLWVSGNGSGITGTSAANFHNVMVEEGDRPGSYFHGWYGDDARYTYAWEGEAGASVSVRYDALGGLISTTVGDQVNITHTEYAPVTVTVTAPRGAKRATMVPEVLGLAVAGEVAHVSRLSFHPGVDTRWQPGGFASEQTLRVERSLDGVRWAQVDDRVGVDHWQRALVLDRLMPLGTRVRYRAFTDVSYPDGSRLSSGSSPEAVLTVDSNLWVIRDPSDPEGEVNALVVGHDRGDDDAATVSRPTGREYAVVDTEGAQSAEGTLTIYVPGDERERTVELLRRSVALLVQSPIGAVFLAHFLHRDYEPEMGGARTIPAKYVEVG